MSPSGATLARAALLLAAFASCRALAATGDAAAGGEAQTCASYIVPINSEMYKAVLPDGSSKTFVLDGQAELAEVAGGNWAGRMNGERIAIMPDSAVRSHREGYVFIGGHLKAVVSNGVAAALADAPAPCMVRPQDSIWPSDAMTEAEKARYDLWATSGRLRFGKHGNPNTAAALFVEIGLAALAAVFCRRWLVALAGFAAFVGCAFAVAQTASRSGFLAMVAGGMVIILAHSRRLVRGRGIAVSCLALALVTGGVLASGVGHRFTAGMFATGDDSNSARIVLWERTPQMMWLAPDGWGLGCGGTAYNDWFEAFDRAHPVASLFNTHLTWLVEFGWPMRAAYVFAWLMVLGLCLRHATSGKGALPLAAWTAFGVAMSFNHLGPVTWLWPMPIACLATVVARRRPAREWLACAGIAALCAASVVVTLCAWGARQNAAHPSVARHSGGRIIVGAGEPSVWILLDEFVMDGDYRGFFGKEVRRWRHARNAAHPPTVGFAGKPSLLPPNARNVVATGRTCSDLVRMADLLPDKFPMLERLTLLSPDIAPADIPSFLVERYDLKMIQGEFVASRNADGAAPRPWLATVPGAEIYISNWLDIVVARAIPPEPAAMAE